MDNTNTTTDITALLAEIDAGMADARAEFNEWW